MPVTFTLLSDGIQKMDMSTISDWDGSPRPATEFVEMILIKIRSKFHLMDMVAHSDRNYLAGYNCKPMIVRVCFGFSNLNAAQHLMNMGLLHGPVWPALTVT